MLDFAPQHFEIDAEVAEIGQFACSLAPARGRIEGGAGWGGGVTFCSSKICYPSSCWSEAAHKLTYLRDFCIDFEALWRKIKHEPIILSNGGVARVLPSEFWLK